MPATKAAPEPALEVFLGRLGAERVFALRNSGDESVFDVDLDVSSEEGRIPPIVAAERAKKFPLEELRPGEEATLQAIITTGTGLRFRCEVSWRTAAGEERKIREYLSV